MHDSLSRGVHDIDAILVIGFSEVIFGREPSDVVISDECLVVYIIAERIA